MVIATKRNMVIIAVLTLGIMALRKSGAIGFLNGRGVAQNDNSGSGLPTTT